MPRACSNYSNIRSSDEFCLSSKEPLQHAMNKLYKQRFISIWRQFYTASLGILLLCIVSLSACNGIMASKPPVKPTPTPTIEGTLKNQGTAQLKSFQKWIALMQQYQGDTTTYQQQYQSDEQALRAATTDAAYQKALKTLNAHVAAIQIPALQTENNALFQQLKQEAAQFGKKHTYYDSYN